MNDIETLRDYMIADEIERIYLLSPEGILNELISLRTQQIELMPAQELLDVCKNKNEN